jgi:hypothetical protein
VTVSEAGKVYEKVRLRIKGAVGSFRAIDDKPSLTLDFGADADRRFHGLRRIHLENSVEDPTYLNQLLGGDIFRAAGIPAPRATYALVSLNGRPSALYVLREGFTEDFLAENFKKAGADLYEPIDGHDIDLPMKRCSVEGIERGPDQLGTLIRAVSETDLRQRWKKTQEVLDIDRFLTFMVLEVLLGHRDGYCLARNNFRVYHNLDNGKFLFIPHGMDQLFGKPDYPWQPSMSGMVARAIMETPEGRQKYLERFASAFSTFYNLQSITNEVARVLEVLRPNLGRSEFTGIEQEASELKIRIIQRQQYLLEQLRAPAIPQIQFVNGVGKLSHWAKVDEPGEGAMNQFVNSDGTSILRITAPGDSSASWRTKAQLNRGRYQFLGNARALGIRPLPYGVRQGAGLRVGGSTRTGEDLVGDCDWQRLETEFVVEKDASAVEFVCELRASAGEVWYDVESLRIRLVNPVSPPPESP